MANKTITTNFFRVFHPHLVEPQEQKQGEPKYGVVMAFPKAGTLPAHIGSASTAVDNISAALDEVCRAEWNVGFNDAITMRQVKFPPQWKDGDFDFEKDKDGNLIQGKVKEHSAGMWMLNVKNVDPIGAVDPTGKHDIDISTVYAGSWARAQLEVSAYVNKDKASIIVVKLVNLQKCYDDANLSGGGNKQTATQAFAGMAVEDTNIVQTGFHPTPTGGPATPGAPVTPNTPQAPVNAPAAVEKVLVQVEGAQYTIEACRAVNWSDDDLVNNGIAVWKEVPVQTSTPAAPNTPQAPGQTPATPGSNLPGSQYLEPPTGPGGPNTPATPGTPVTPGTPGQP